MSNLLKITVKKFEKGSTVTCSKCHQEGHKSNKCLNQRRSFRMRRTRRSLQSRVLSSTPSPTGGTRAIAPPIWSKRRQIARWLLTRLGRRKGVGTTPFGCPRTSSPIWRGLKWCGFQRRLKAKDGFGGFGGLAYKLKWRFKPKKLSSQRGHLLPKSPIR